MIKNNAHAGRGRRWRALAAIALAGALALTACGGSGGSTTGSGDAPKSTDYGKPVSGGDLVAVQTVSPTSLDPIVGGSGGDHVSLWPLYARLVNFSADLKAEPGLAKSWDYPDPQTLVFTLQPNVKFQDGTPLDAAAVKFNIDRARTLPTSTVKQDLTSITSVDATAPDTVTLHLSQPDSSLPLIFADRAGMMASPTAVQAEGDAFGANPVGAGPFKFVSFAPGDKLVMTKNTDYWEPGKPYLDNLTIKYIANGQTGNNALVGNQVDFVNNVSLQLASSLKAKSGITVVSAPSISLQACYFNFTKAPFNNLKARQALAYAIDKDALNKALNFGQGGEAASQLFPSEHWAYEKGLKDPYKYDPKKAKKLWDDAGLANYTIDAQGYNAPGQQRKLEIIQEQLKKAGIKMSVAIKDVSAANDDFYVGFKPDLYCSGWSGRPDPSGTYSALLSPESFYTAGDSGVPNLDEMIDAGKAETDPAARVEAYKPLAKLAQDQMLYLTQSFAPIVVAFRDSVKGYVSTLYGKPDVSFLWLSK